MDFEPNWPFDTSDYTMWELSFAFLTCMRPVPWRTATLLTVPLSWKQTERTHWGDRAGGLPCPAASHSPDKPSSTVTLAAPWAVAPCPWHLSNTNSTFISASCPSNEQQVAKVDFQVLHHLACFFFFFPAL